VTTIRTGPIQLPNDFDDEVDFDAQIAYGTQWQSINDHINFRVASESFGTTGQTYRRIELSSSFYAGTYDVNHVPDAQKRNMVVWVRGRNFEDLATARDQLVTWFTQDDFILRIVRGDTYEYWECHCADYQIDESQAMMFNRMCKLSFTMSVMPGVQTYVVL
jgi:hypothetical protein